MSIDQRSPISLPTALTATSMYCGVAVDNTGNAVAPAAGAAIIGVLYGLSGTGTAASIRTPCDGRVKLLYGGSVTVGDKLKVDNTGKFLTASASDVAAGSAVAVALETGASGEVHSGVLLGNSGAAAEVLGTDDIVLGTTAPSGITSVTFVQTTGTKTGVLPNGVFAGQKKRIVQSVAASTPAGTITGAFKTLAGAAATTLTLGTAVAYIGEFVWDGAAWRLASALGGTGSSVA